MSHNRLASRSALAAVRQDVRFSGVFDKIIDFFTGKVEEKIGKEPEPSSEEQRRAEDKFESDVRDIVDKSISGLVEMNFSPDKIRSLREGGAVSKEFADAVRKSGLNLINYTYEYYRYMIGHALKPSFAHFGITKEQAEYQEDLVKKKLGTDEPAEFDAGHLKRQKERSTPFRTRTHSFHHVASRIAARDEDEDDDDIFGEDTGDHEDAGDDSEGLGDDDFGLEDNKDPEPGEVSIDFTSGPTEYSCRIELSMTATFEGSVSRNDLTSKIQDELKASIEAGMKAVSNDLSLQSTEVRVMPILMECAVVDESDYGMDDFGMSPQDGDDSSVDDDEDNDIEGTDEDEEEEDELTDDYDSDDLRVRFVSSVMKMKQFQFPAESLAKFSHLEASIAHWSHEHTVLSLKARKALDGIDNLFQARQKIVDEFLTAQDLRAADVENVSISPNGEVIVVMKEPAEPAEAPSNGAS